MVKLLKEIKTRLFITTDHFPTGGELGDSMFIMPEIPYLAKAFQTTVVCERPIEPVLPPIVDSIDYYYHFHKIPMRISKRIKWFLMYLIDHVCWMEVADIIKRNFVETHDGVSSLLRQLYQSMGFYAKAQEFFSFFSCFVPHPTREKAVFYSFWYNECALGFALHRSDYPNFDTLTRLHGYDCFEDAFQSGRQPFKRFMNDKVDRLCFVGQTARNEFYRVYPDMDESKLFVMRLGSSRIDRKGFNPDVCKTFTLVSCSNVVSVKRLDMIIDALARLDIRIKWIHFGNGDDMSRTVKMAGDMLSPMNNISYEFRGRTPNEKIRDYYGSGEASCYIITSRHEGGPISAMEAISAGIPIIGTKTGEIPYMIRDNGVLLDENPTAEDIAAAIRAVYDKWVLQKQGLSGSYHRMCENSYQVWKDGFNLEENTKRFVDDMVKRYIQSYEGTDL